MPKRAKKPINSVVPSGNRPLFGIGEKLRIGLSQPPRTTTVHDVTWVAEEKEHYYSCDDAIWRPEQDLTRLETMPKRPKSPGVDKEGQTVGHGGSEMPKQRKSLVSVLNPSEHDIQATILDYLALRSQRTGCYFCRINTAALKGEYKGKKRFFRSAPKGCADILVWEAREPWTLMDTGRGKLTQACSAWALEVKRKNRGQSAEQVTWMHEFERGGGVYAVVRSVEDVEGTMGKIP